jgi:hypothetical protein
MPVLAMRAGRHTGRLPADLTALAVGPGNVQVTAAMPHGEGLLLRLYESSGTAAMPVAEGERFRIHDLAGLDGRPRTSLGPFQIGHAVVRPVGRSPAP